MKKKRSRRKTPKTEVAKVATGFSPRGRQTLLSKELQAEICSKIAGGDTKTDAALTTGVALSTLYDWQKASPDFLEAVRQAEATRRRVYRALIRKAGIGDGKKPGDWRATAHLGSLSDPKEFVPQINLHVTGQFDDALDKLKAALDPEAYARALHAIAGGEGEDPLEPDEGGDGSGGARPGGGGSPKS